MTFALAEACIQRRSPPLAHCACVCVFHTISVFIVRAPWSSHVTYGRTNTFRNTGIEAHTRLAFCGLGWLGGWTKRASEQTNEHACTCRSHVFCVALDLCVHQLRGCSVIDIGARACAPHTSFHGARRDVSNFDIYS